MDSLAASGPLETNRFAPPECFGVALSAMGRAYLDLLRTVLLDLHRLPAPEFDHDQGAGSVTESRTLRETGRDWPVNAETMIGARRLGQFQQAIETVVTEGVPGDIIETGVWRGGACILARAVLRAFGVADRSVWLADSFVGLPAPDLEHFPQDAGDEHFKQDFLRVSRKEVEYNFLKYDLLDNQVKFLEGWFQDTLPTAPIQNISVLRLDGDMYGSTIVALESLYDRMVPGGFVIIDDYGAVPGCREAVEDFRSARGIVAPMEVIDWTGRFWRVPAEKTQNQALDIWPGYSHASAEALVKDAESAFASGDEEAAVRGALAALEIEPNAMPAHLLLSSIAMPGPNYLEQLAWIHATKRPACYLEIGVFFGASMNLVHPGCWAIGVDPFPRIASSARKIIVPMTSDSFFNEGEADRLIPETGVELAFIDGLHTFPQILRDFINVERYASRDGWIILHDVVPLDESTSSRERTTTFYSGEAWIVLAALTDFRPDLRIRILRAGPTGLAIIDQLAPDSRLLESSFERLIEYYSGFGWAEYLERASSLGEILDNRLGSYYG